MYVTGMRVKQSTGSCSLRPPLAELCHSAIRVVQCLDTGLLGARTQERR